MGLLSRRPGPPASLLALLDLPRGDRVLASAETPEGWVVGTRTLLGVLPTDAAGTGAGGGAGPGAGPGVGVVRLPWEEVESADWDQEAESLRVVEVGDFGHTRAEHQLRLDPTSALLPLVRERVTASIVLQLREVVGGRRGFLVVGRRSPAGGPVRWLVEYDAGVDPADPDVERLVAAAVRRAQGDVDPSS